MPMFRFWLLVRISLSINVFKRRTCLLNENQLVNKHKDQINRIQMDGGDQQCKASENLPHMSKQQILTPDSSFRHLLRVLHIFPHWEAFNVIFSDARWSSWDHQIRGLKTKQVPHEEAGLMLLEYIRGCHQMTYCLSFKDFLNKIDAQSVLIKSWMWYSLHLKINKNNIIGKGHKTFVFRLLYWTPPLQESCSDPGLLHKSRPTSVRSGILTVSSHLHLMSASNSACVNNNC